MLPLRVGTAKLSKKSSIKHPPRTLNPSPRICFSVMSNKTSAEHLGTSILEGSTLTMIDCLITVFQSYLGEFPYHKNGSNSSQSP